MNYICEEWENQKIEVALKITVSTVNCQLPPLGIDTKTVYSIEKQQFTAYTTSTLNR